MSATSFDVRVWGIRTVKGDKGNRYQVRWIVGGHVHHNTCATRKLADSFRSSLVHAARTGEPFDVESGRPTGSLPRDPRPTWFEHAQAFMDMKWPDASPRHRQSTAEGLTTITLALTEGQAPGSAVDARRALRLWAFNTAARRDGSAPPAEFAEELAWLAARSRPLADLSEPTVLRLIFAAIATNLDGSPASPATTSRKRAALSAALGYAVELGHLPANPLPRVKVKRRPLDEAIDARVVVSPNQARALLAAVKGRAPALHAYFACLYFAGLRPGEAANLRAADLMLPEQGWGEILLSGSYQPTRGEWTDDGARGEERALKHRARSSTRRVPAAPELVAALREHLDDYGTGAEGRLFVTRTGKTGRPVAQPFVRPVSSASTTRVLGFARAAAFTPQQQASPLARRPYDLRHACVSTWLAAGVAPSQVAAWAGHSVAVLLRVYAHAVDGQEDAARRRIDEALGPISTTAQPLLNHKPP